MATSVSVPCQGRIKQTSTGKSRQCANQQLGRHKFWFQLRKPKKAAKRTRNSVYIHFLHREGLLYLLRIGPTSSDSF